jgi:hypothetical protein
MILGNFRYHLGVKISQFRKPFSKTQKFENPSKTIVFTVYFQGRALKYHVKIDEKTKQNRVLKSITRN